MQALHYLAEASIDKMNVHYILNQKEDNIQIWNEMKKAVIVAVKDEPKKLETVMVTVQRIPSDSNDSQKVNFFFERENFI